MSRLMLLLCCVLWMSGCSTFDPPPKTTAAITFSQALADVRNGIYEMQGSKEECIKKFSGTNATSAKTTTTAAGNIVVGGVNYGSSNATDADDRCRKAGLLVKEVEVTFKITGAEKKTAGTELGFDPSNLLVEFPSAKFTQGSENSEERGNTIRFKFENVYLAGKDTLLGMDVERRIAVLKPTAPKQGAKPQLIPVAQTSPIDDAINGIGGAQLIQAYMKEIEELREFKEVMMARDPEIEKQVREKQG